MMVNTLALQDDFELPNVWLAFGAAATMHWILFMWNPTLLSGGAYQAPPLLMQVEYKEKLPELVKPEPPKPIVHEEKKKPLVKKARKSGLTLTKAHKTVPVHRKPVPVKQAVKPKTSSITIPKYIPQVNEDEPIAGTPHPGMAPPVTHTVQPALAASPKLVGKTRGVKLSDVRFELEEGGTLTQNARAGAPVVAIPLGEERGEVAQIPDSPFIHDAPRTEKKHFGYSFVPGNGQGLGELAGKSRTGYHAVIKGEVSAEAALAASYSGHTQAGSGFEIGGPVGDRKIISQKLPEYPAWAEEKHIEAVVKIYFTVKPEGSLRQTMRVLRSSGYAELDRIAQAALAEWKFSPTTASSTEEEAWGVITFHFTLS